MSENNFQEIIRQSRTKVEPQKNNISDTITIVLAVASATIESAKSVRKMLEESSKPLPQA
jgi:hypothetical protein